MEDTVELSDSLIQTLTTFLESELIRTKRRAIPMPDIFSAQKVEIEKAHPELDTYKFRKALSQALKTGRMEGYETKLGKGGGVGKISPSSKKKESTEVISNIPSLPVEEEMSDLEMDGKVYRLSLSKDRLEKMMTKVFSMRKDPEGSIVFADESFTIEDPVLKEAANNFAFYFEVIN